MNWLGLDWSDIVLNIVVLAIVPGLFAAYGGHLAAESISDVKRQRKIKAIFWMMFIVYVIATGLQQFRVAEAELNRDTKETWADAMALRILQAPQSVPAFAYTKAAAAPMKSDVALSFANSENPGATVSLLTSTTARNVSVNPLLWDLDAFSGSSLTTTPFKLDWIRKDQQESTFQLLIPSDIGTVVKPGHRIFGCVWVTCVDCEPAARTYWLYFIFGRKGGGWSAELPKGKAPVLARLSAKVPEIRDNTEASLSQLVPASQRRLIQDVP